MPDNPILAGFRAERIGPDKLLTTWVETRLSNVGKIPFRQERILGMPDQTADVLGVKKFNRGLYDLLMGITLICLRRNIVLRMARKGTGEPTQAPQARVHFLAVVSLDRERVDTRYSVSWFGWLGAFWLSLAFLGFSKHSFKEFKWQMCGVIGAAALFSAITFHLLRPNELQLLKLY